MIPNNAPMVVVIRYGHHLRGLWSAPVVAWDEYTARVSIDGTLIDLTDVKAMWDVVGVLTGSWAPVEAEMEKFAKHVRVIAAAEAKEHAMVIARHTSTGESA